MTSALIMIILPFHSIYKSLKEMTSTTKQEDFACAMLSIVSSHIFYRLYLFIMPLKSDFTFFIFYNTGKIFRTYLYDKYTM